MLTFRNNPRFEGTNKVQNQHNIQQNRPFWKHQPITITQHNTTFSISEAGKVTISVSSPDPKDENGVIVDEVTISAGLIFKIAGYLKDTRTAVEDPKNAKVSTVNEETKV